ncbi:cytochrome P450 [Capsaspora owczarzaki ATCC 30864]|uniref:Cytochrome P450 n=1 Tax=Capsaspora owczarzaki (strain ATCC 30864) TaxID=595528 RepID=A0A0D2UJ45_CAPO3|nr:cytochrome P450 [Capsaspora owczarzaki ATCC 30864]KJE95106.1 cytochrome P450 [Capsaspora owczarzaki ATCC 30864]|eukprot:XP_004346268.1 cytochrome P450 [Capsaspora owczarzaki ATCC 30864]
MIAATFTQIVGQLWGLFAFIGSASASATSAAGSALAPSGSWTLTAFLVFATFSLAVAYLLKSMLTPPPAKLPPYIPSRIPFLGSAVEFGQDPINFLHNAFKKHGEIFCFKMLGRYCVYLIGSESSGLLFNSKNDLLNAEEVYANLTVPVFGKGVAYDVDNKIFSEQKRMLKTGLTQARLQTYAPLIEEETRQYFARWGQSGEANLFEALAQVIILTASRCLLGEEIRAMLDDSVAGLYHDLDGGFTQEAWMLPSWLPLPSFRKRDRAHLKIKQIFHDIIERRRAVAAASGQDENEDENEDSGAANNKKQDMLQTLMDSTYKDGRPLTNDEIAGMLIGLLLAGQHTSSTTSSWLGFFIARDKAVQDALRREQYEQVGSGSSLHEELPPIENNHLDKFELLDRVLRETLRMRPPILTMMRMSKEAIPYKDFVIPEGTYVCVSPTINHLLDETWDQPMQFKPDRFLTITDRSADESVPVKEKFSYVPFGAGRHRCIGETFAYTQIKTIWSVLLRDFEIELVDNKFPGIDFSTLIHMPKDPYVRYRRRVPL